MTHRQPPRSRGIALVAGLAVLLAGTAVAASAQAPGSPSAAPEARGTAAAPTSATAVPASSGPSAAGTPAPLAAAASGALAVVTGTATASPIGAGGPMAMVLSDSELVYGPTLYRFDAEADVAARGGYLARYREIVDGEVLTGAAVVQRVAEDFGVGPRLLLALVEAHSRWVTAAEPAELNFPLPERLPGLHPALSAAADEIGRAFYGWSSGATASVTLADGATARVDAPNAATFAIMAYYAARSTAADWAALVGPSRFHHAWTALFGDPYVFRVTAAAASPPAVPRQLPFAAGETWFYVLGPHSPWGAGGPRAAVDLAPPGQADCAPVPHPVRAAAAGRVLRSRGSGVLVDLDRDGYVGTGWVDVYLHLAALSRVEEGVRVEAGQPLGYASCEGGATGMARVSYARRFEGRWVPADDPVAPLQLGGWAAVPGRLPGEGWLIGIGFPPRRASPVKDPAVNGVAGAVVP